MANKYVQYGAVVATGVGVAAVTTGIAAGIKSGVQAGIDTATQTATGAVSNPGFLTGVGLGLAAIALGSGSKRPSLNFPNLAATAAVALNVSNLIQQGKAAASSLAQSKAGLDITSKIGPPVALRSPYFADPSIMTDQRRSHRQTFRLVYPDDLTNQYYIRFGLYRYERLDKSNNTIRADNPHTSIRLPIPANLIDAISLAYQDIGLGVFGGAVFEGVAGELNKTAPTTGKDEVIRQGAAGVRGLIKAGQDPSFLPALARRFVSNLDPGLGAMFDLATGTAPNPHMTVSFQGVALKKYQFNWRISPNNEKESKTVEKIIRNLQASALPAKNGAFMLSFPDVVKIEMEPSNLFIFKPMMIDNVSVNYAPSGSPSFFRGGDESSNRYPTEMELSISLREIDIHTSSDADYMTTRAFQNYSDPANVPVKI